MQAGSLERIRRWARWGRARGPHARTLVRLSRIPAREEDLRARLADALLQRAVAETALQETRDELERTRAKELDQTRTGIIARERQSMLGQVTATVSHELRNPLGVIRSSVFYLQRRLGRQDERIVKHLERIEQQVVLCNGVIDELLEFTRGRQVYAIPGDLNAWLESASASWGALPEGAKLRTDLQANLPPVPFDSERLSRALANLVDNAVLALRARSEIPAPREWEPEIVLRSRLNGAGVVVELADNGVGMDDATLRRALDPLFTTRARGTGLGLPIVRRIVEEHGGSVRLESTPGFGTLVRLVLPLVGAPHGGEQEPVA